MVLSQVCMQNASISDNCLDVGRIIKFSQAEYKIFMNPRTTRHLNATNKLSLPPQILTTDFEDLDIREIEKVKNSILMIV